MTILSIAAPDRQASIDQAVAYLGRGNKPFPGTGWVYLSDLRDAVPEIDACLDSKRFEVSWRPIGDKLVRLAGGTDYLPEVKNGAHFRMLVTMERMRREGAPITLPAVAKRHGITKSYAYSLLGRLVAGGLVDSSKEECKLLLAPQQLFWLWGSNVRGGATTLYDHVGA